MSAPMKYANVVESKIFENKLKNILTLLLSKESINLRVFASIILSMKIEVIDTKNPDVYAWCVFNQNERESGIIDLHMYFGKAFVESENATEQKILFVMFHEIMHLLRKHPSKGMLYHDDKYFILACEHIANSISKEVFRIFKNESGISIPTPDEAVIFDELWDEFGANCTEKDAYLWIKNRMNRFQIEPSDSIEGGNGGESSLTVTDTKTGKTYKIYLHNNNDPNNGNNIKNNDIENCLNNLITKAKSTHNKIGGNRGTGNNNIGMIIDNLLNPPINWKIILDELVIKYIKIDKKTVISYVNPNRRRMIAMNRNFKSRLILPGPLPTKSQNEYGLVYIGTDVSGSEFDNEILSEFGGIVSKAFDYFSHIEFVTHDVPIIDDKIFKNKNEFTQYLKTVGVSGGGGTSHEAIFEDIEKKYTDNDPTFKNSLSVVIFLTDGYSDIEYLVQKKTYIWMTEIPIIFLCNSNAIFKLENINKEIFKSITITIG